MCWRIELRSIIEFPLLSTARRTFRQRRFNPLREQAFRDGSPFKARPAIEKLSIGRSIKGIPINFAISERSLSS